MMALSIDDFDKFFSEVHGADFRPFPWQKRLLEKVVAGNGWREIEAIGAPTASGKTCTLDVAVFALALDGGVSHPRRIFFVVDRRLVVDQAYDHARKLQRALSEAEEGTIAFEVASRLKAVTGAELSKKLKYDPLQVFQLRGGIYRDQSWAALPSTPTIVCSTVDQLGSRLLFRGYGASPYACSYQAGLAGFDSLVILDEAHCSVPFSQTIEKVSRFGTKSQVKQNNKSLTEPAPTMAVTIMSATNSRDILSVELEKDDFRHPVLGKRLGARKLSGLEIAEKAKGKNWTEKLAQYVVGRAEELQKERELGVVAILVNRVATARHAERLLRKQKRNAILLTGRMRELDRQRLFKRHGPKLRSGTRKEDWSEPLFVVATQCVEVGADFDFDGLVTECASLDALRQRFGRLDRLGEKSPTSAVIVMPQEQINPKVPDPIYGEALEKTWKFLNSCATGGVVDMGVRALKDLLPSGEKLSELCAPVHDAPVLLPAHIDCLVQTAPRPNPDVDPSVFLHGTRKGSPEVRVLWRKDLIERDDTSDGGTKILNNLQFRELMAIVPPAVSETLPVPLHTFRRWLVESERDEDLGSDIEHSDFGGIDVPGEVLKTVFLWRGPQDDASGRLEKAYGVRPGDTVIVTEVDHLKELGDIPGDLWVSEELGDLAQLESRRKAVLRLPAGANGDGRSEIQAVGAELYQDIENGDFDGKRAYNRIKKLLDTFPVNETLFDGRQEVIEQIRPARKCLSRDDFKTYPGASGGGVILVYKLRANQSDDKNFSQNEILLEEPMTNEDDSANDGERVTLQKHCSAAGSLAAQFGKACGLTDEIVHDLRLAGLWHDLGKADPKFQAWLYDGNEILARSRGELLAKSRQDFSQRKLYKKMAGYPDGKRHEFLSAAWVAANKELSSQAHDLDLVLHLIATHHGRARPFSPMIEEEGTASVDFLWEDHRITGSTQASWPGLESGHLERFNRCIARYGWWGLSFLESLVVCADHLASKVPELSLEPPIPLKLKDRVRHQSVKLQELDFPNINGGELLGFLAALGLLRTIHSIFPETKLGWSLERVWSPRLWLPESIGKEQFVRLIEGRLRSTEWPRVMEVEDNTHKLKVSQYRGYEVEAIERVERDHCDWLSALACGSVVTNDDCLADTKFRTMSGAGHQHFLKTMRELREETTAEHLEQCLFHPWSYQDDKPSLRFDPEDDRRYALRWREPSKDPVKTVRGANRLAVEALPLFACLPTPNGMQTVGFEGSGAYRTFFDWPIWEEPLTPGAVRLLLHQVRWFAEDPKSANIGVVEVFRAQRITVGKVRNFTPSRSRLAAVDEFSLLL